MLFSETFWQQTAWKLINLKGVEIRVTGIYKTLEIIRIKLTKRKKNNYKVILSANQKDLLTSYKLTYKYRTVMPHIIG